jgi:DNA-binding transcriptional ArsR family regulator
MIGRIIRAQRPSVTAALKELREHGFLCREPDGTWVIHGDPSQQLRRLAGE